MLLLKEYLLRKAKNQDGVQQHFSQMADNPSHNQLDRTCIADRRLFSEKLVHGAPSNRGIYNTTIHTTGASPEVNMFYI